MSDTTATAPVVFESVELSRRLDAIWAAWRAGVFTEDERETRSAPLRELLHQAAADEYGAVVAAMGGDVSLLAVGTWVVVAGELIESAWGNQVRADLLAHDTAIAGKVAKTGDQMTGSLTVGVDASMSRPASLVRSDGTIASSITGESGATILTNSINLARGGTPGDPGGQFLRFSRGATNTTGNQNPIGSITVAPGGSGVVYNASSDYRLKDDRGPIQGALTRIAGLIPRRIVWKTDPDQTEMDGFFAHEVTPVVPEAVTGEKDGVFPPEDPYNAGDPQPQQLDTGQLIPLIVAAVQELTARLEQLEGAPP